MLTQDDRENLRAIMAFAIEIIEDEFGDGYAIKNPALVASVFDTLSEFSLSIKCAG